MHNHPFRMRCAVLRGGYDEELMGVGVVPRRPYFGAERVFKNVVRTMLDVGKPSALLDIYVDALQPRTVDPFTWHRIASAEPGTWTLCAVDAPRLPHWYFLDDSGELEQVAASPREWWASC